MPERGEGLGFPAVCLLLAIFLVGVGFGQAEQRRDHLSARASDACLAATTSEQLQCHVEEYREATLAIIWPYLVGGALTAAFGMLYLGTRRRTRAGTVRQKE
jgi:hypothetical protein